MAAITNEGEKRRIGEHVIVERPAKTGIPECGIPIRALCRLFLCRIQGPPFGLDLLGLLMVLLLNVHCLFIHNGFR
jgi:hypothetical protein